jgi:spermidine synthase
LLPVLYAATLFIGATLLFLVQPLIGKVLLPLLGGTPGVWNTCMVFFQAVLLGGYLYAHRSIARLGIRRQAVLHLGLLLLIPIAFAVAVSARGTPVPGIASLLPADQDYPVFGLIAFLAAAVGVPFFVLSTTAPLLQRWFASTGHASARDPYFLYAASNAGSLLGLLAYPFLIEPRLPLAEQQWIWAAGVGIYAVMVLVCAVTVLRREDSSFGPSRNPSPKRGGEKESGFLLSPPSLLGKGAGGLGSSGGSGLRWAALAALPSAMLLAVTTHLTTDLAPVPLLWVVPLSLYLLSFILVFARWPDRVHRGVGRITPMLLLFVVVSLVTDAAEPWGLIAGLHLAAFFGVCLVCHGELAKHRPPAEQLTAFYFWLSLGGVVGGAFTALLAPVIFHRLGLVEYPLLLVLAALVRPRSGEVASGLRPVDVALVLGLLAIALSLVYVVPRHVELPAESDAADAMVSRLIRSGLMFGLPAVVAFALVRRPVRYALALAAIFFAGALAPSQLGETLYRERNFFGVVKVVRSTDGKFIRMVHGRTLHGQQRTDETGPPRPMTYYHERGPVGNLFRSLPPERLRKVAVVGLGTGAIAAYAKPGQEWTFYEIDPAVARIASDTNYFTFLSNCRADRCDIVLGDARRQLTRAPDGGFDLLILDAFSSDAIPVHLLTREALALYVQKLAPGGVLAMHLSNNHLDLPPLVDRMAADFSPPLIARYNHDFPTDPEKADGKTASQWMVLARSAADLGPMARGPHWQPLRDRRDGPVWRDDFANLLSVWKRDEGDE